MSCTKQLLLVEGDPDQRELFRLLLDRSDCQVTAVSSTENALVKLATHTYDLMVTDLFDHRIQGEVLVRTLKLRSPQAKVLVVSDSLHAAETSRACNADGYLPRLEYHRLAAMVKNFL